MKELEEKFIKEVESLEMDILETLRFILYELLSFEWTEYYDANVWYNKTYFSNYYSVDIKTFNKWIELFCPKIYQNKYESKRKFNRNEFDTIIESLGQCDRRKMRPYSRIEIGNILYEKKNWQKSKKYQELCLELKLLIPEYNANLNKFPPKIVNQIFMKFNQLDLSDTILKSQTNNTVELKKKRFFELIEKKKKMTFQESIVERNQTINYIKSIFKDEDGKKN